MMSLVFLRFFTLPSPCQPIYKIGLWSNVTFWQILLPKQVTSFMDDPLKYQVIIINDVLHNEKDSKKSGFRAFRVTHHQYSNNIYTALVAAKTTKSRSNTEYKMQCTQIGTTLSYSRKVQKPKNRNYKVSHYNSSMTVIFKFLVLFFPWLSLHKEYTKCYIVKKKKKYAFLF